MRGKTTKEFVRAFIEVFLLLVLLIIASRGCNPQQQVYAETNEQGVIVVTHAGPDIIELLWLDNPPITSEGQLEVRCTIISNYPEYTILNTYEFYNWFNNAFYLELNQFGAYGTVLSCRGEHLITGETASLFQPVSYDFRNVVYMPMIRRY